MIDTDYCTVCELPQVTYVLLNRSSECCVRDQAVLRYLLQSPVSLVAENLYAKLSSLKHSNWNRHHFVFIWLRQRGP